MKDTRLDRIAELARDARTLLREIVDEQPERLQDRMALDGIRLKDGL